MSIDKFQNTFIKILDKYTTTKHKYVRANQVPYTNLQKAVIDRSPFRKNILVIKLWKMMWLTKRQRNYCVNLFKRQNKIFYIPLDNKTFWKVIKPSFSDKMSSNINITLGKMKQ